jgi:hypothetical protein
LQPAAHTASNAIATARLTDSGCDLRIPNLRVLGIGGSLSAARRVCPVRRYDDAFSAGEFSCRDARSVLPADRARHLPVSKTNRMRYAEVGRTRRTVKWLRLRAFSQGTTRVISERTRDRAKQVG